MNAIEIAKDALNHPRTMTEEHLKALKLVVHLAETQIPEYSKLVSRCVSLENDLAMLGGCFTCSRANECNQARKYKPAPASYYKSVARVSQEGSKLSVFYYDKRGLMKKRSGFDTYDEACLWCKESLKQSACPDVDMVTTCSSWAWRGACKTNNNNNKKEVKNVRCN